MDNCLQYSIDIVCAATEMLQYAVTTYTCINPPLPSICLYILAINVSLQRATAMCVCSECDGGQCSTGTSSSSHRLLHHPTWYVSVLIRMIWDDSYDPG